MPHHTPQPSSSAINLDRHDVAARFRAFCAEGTPDLSSPFNLYKSFLPYSHEHKDFWAMKAAKEHRDLMLRVAIDVLRERLGPATVRLMLRKEEADYRVKVAERRGQQKQPKEFQKEIGGKVYIYRRLAHLWERTGPDGQRTLLRHLPLDVE